MMGLRWISLITNFFYRVSVCRGKWTRMEGPEYKLSWWSLVYGPQFDPRKNLQIKSPCLIGNSLTNNNFVIKDHMTKTAQMNFFWEWDRPTPSLNLIMTAIFGIHPKTNQLPWKCVRHCSHLDDKSSSVVKIPLGHYVSRWFEGLEFLILRPPLNIWGEVWKSTWKVEVCAMIFQYSTFPLTPVRYCDVGVW